MKEIEIVFEYIPFWKYCFMQRYVKNFIRSFIRSVERAMWPLLSDWWASQATYLSPSLIKERPNLLGSRSRSLYDEEYDSFSGVFESTSVKFDRAHYCLRLEERKNSKKKNEKWMRSRRKVEKKSIIWLEIILNREFHQNSHFLLKLENSISVLFYLIAIYSYSSFLIYLYLVEKLRFRKWKIRINVISKNLPLENI